jgi:hypothetical protein
LHETQGSIFSLNYEAGVTEQESGKDRGLPICARGIR